VAVDVIAMNSARSDLPSRKTDHAFLIFVQQLDLRYRCVPLHTIQHESGQATPDVRKMVTADSSALSNHRLMVHYECARGDQKHDATQKSFFHQRMVFFCWRAMDWTRAISYVSQATDVASRGISSFLKEFDNL
jgi:hypothetical protein